MGRKKNTTPATKRIALEMEREIRSGMRNPGDQLPSIRALAERKRVDPASVLGAYRILEQLNLVVREHGRGCYVAKQVRPDILPGRRIYGFHEAKAGSTDLYPNEFIEYNYGFYHNYPKYFDFLKEKGEREPGLILMDENMLPIMAEEGLLRPLDDLVQKSPNISDVLRNIDPACKRAFMYHARTFALPIFCAPVMAYFNRRLFKEAGVALPGENWSWDHLFELLDQFTRFTNKGRFEHGAMGLLLDPNGCMPLIGQFGGELFDRNGNCSIGSEAFYKGVCFFEKVIQHLGCCVHKLGDKREFLGELLANGRLAFIIGSEQDAALARATLPKEDFYELPIPGTNQGSLTTCAARGIGMTSGSYNPSELLTFLEAYYTLDHLKFFADRNLSLSVLNGGLTEPSRKARALSRPVVQCTSRKKAEKQSQILNMIFHRVHVSREDLLKIEEEIMREMRD